MDTTINQRVEKIIEVYGLSPNSMAKKLDVASTVIYNIIGSRQSKPSYPLLEKIINSFDGINADWLLTGNGTLKLPNSNSSSPANQSNQYTERVFPIIVDPENIEQISLVPIYAHAGYLKGFEDPGFIKNLPVSNQSKYEDGTYRDFEIKGDSMEPHFFERDIVRAKYLSEIYWDQRLHLGELYIILHKTDGLVFKQVTDHNPETGEISLHSFNSYYNDYIINIRDVGQLWYYKEYRSDRRFNYLR